MSSSSDKQPRAKQDEESGTSDGLLNVPDLNVSHSTNAMGSILLFDAPKAIRDMITDGETESLNKEMMIDRKPRMIRVIRDGTIASQMLKQRNSMLQLAATHEQTQICPKCKEPIPVSELLEHVRIELLDPRGKEQRQRAIAKNKGTNLVVDGRAVVANLNKLAELRPDIFGGDVIETAEKLRVNAEETVKKTVIWDGHQGSRAAARMQRDMLVDPAQRRKLEQEQSAERERASNVIGPQVMPPSRRR